MQIAFRLGGFEITTEIYKHTTDESQTKHEQSLFWGRLESVRDVEFCFSSLILLIS